MDSLEQYRRMFNVELPLFDTMDEYLDFILSKIRPMSEDLNEHEYWWDRRWMEVRDDVRFHEAVLHIFSDEGGYMVSVDGNISRGGWHWSAGGGIIIEHGGRSELYDLAFLNEDFLILKKHGDQRRKGQRKYFVMGVESSVRGLEWRDIMEFMFNIYRNNFRWTGFLAIVIILLAIIFLVSLWAF